ncbi:PIR protein [Plasmodium ovale]|uniref:PIR protein n=1 Tax=Plasmodium ovale TaxID=36330 RepID=A0A1D3JFJ5_PLAOA|nr:PIR protein [Plasmodium ovale]
MGYCDDTLKSLKLYAVYEDFNKDISEGNTIEKCDELKEKLPNYPKFKDLCYKLSRNLKRVCIALQEKDKNTEGCEYINLWLYDLLIKYNMIDNTNNISLSKVITELPHLWVESNFNQKCDLTKYNISSSDFTLMKLLYDYSLNYSTIDLEIKENTIDTVCKSHYCTYISKIIHFYKIAESECDTTPEKAYCVKFNEDKTKIEPNKLFSSLNCTKDDVDDKLTHIQEFISKELLSFFQQTGGYISADESLTEGTPNVSAKIGFSLFVISIISLFLLYKFTPMGSILRTIIRSKLNSSSFLREKLKIPLLQHNEEFENEKSHNTEHNISYLPFGNG